MRNLSVPSGKIDVVLDTDAYNEIDDQFAIHSHANSTRASKSTLRNKEGAI
jgi:hypothetical protein